MAAAAMVSSMPTSSSDPFLSTHLGGRPAQKPKLKLRPASMVFAPLPPFVAPAQLAPPAVAAPPAYTRGASVVAPLSPAPFVGTLAPGALWAPAGPIVPSSPLMPPNPSTAFGQYTPDKEGPRSPMSPLRQEHEDEYGFAAAPMAHSASDRLSPYGRKAPALDRSKASLQRSKLQQLFGKGYGAVGDAGREKSPAGFSFPLTPPLTPPYSAGETPMGSAQRASLAVTPLVIPPYVPPTPPASASSVATDGEVSTRALASHQLHPRFAREYRILGELGSGGFGFVVRAIRLADKRIVAVKFISIGKVPSHAWVKVPNWDSGNHDGTRGGEALIPMEAFVLRRVKHERVVSFIDLFEQGPYFYLVMEHHGTPWVAVEKEKHLTSSSMMPAVAVAEQTLDDSMDVDDSALISSSPTPMSRLSVSPVGAAPQPPRPQAPPMLRRASCDLFECIEQHKRLPEATARFVFFQVCDAVHNLLRLGICHRDIKDENIVIDKQYRVKLIDFGSAVIHDPRQPPPYYNRFWGTLNFASAEILSSQPYRAPQAEVWALGVLLCLLVLGETPFSSVDRAREGRPAVSFNGVSRDCCDLIMRCLIVNPDERITVDQILQHPWLCPSSPPCTASISPPRMTRAASYA